MFLSLQHLYYKISAQLEFTSGLLIFIWFFNALYNHASPEIKKQSH